MTQARTRKATQAAPAPQDDPLADLRDDPAAETAPREPEPEPEQGTIRPMVDQETQDAMVDEAVVTMHADTVAIGFLHKGGTCGCRYIAKVMLRSVVPVMTPEDLAERDLEPAGAE